MARETLRGWLIRLNEGRVRTHAKRPFTVEYTTIAGPSNMEQERTA